MEPSPIGRRLFRSSSSRSRAPRAREGRFPFGKHGRARGRLGCGADSIDMWAAAQEIAKTVPEAKPAEEEPTQTRGPKL